MTLNKGFNISGTTAVKAPKLFMILRLDRKNSFPKFGILPIARSTNWKLFQKVLKWLYFERLRSYMTETYTTFTLLSLLPWWTVSFLFLAIMVKNISWLQWNKKKHFHIFQTTKDIDTLAANYLGLEHSWLQIWCFRNPYFELIGEKKKNLKKSK